MAEATVEKVQEAKSLTAHDRCDQCVSQAYVSVIGMAGELLFCSHHFTKIEKDAEAFKKLQSFAYVIHDERDKVSTERAGL